MNINISELDAKLKSNKLKVGVLGATGMVGQRFLSLLAGHPWYEVFVEDGAEARVAIQSGDVTGLDCYARLGAVLDEAREFEELAELDPTAHEHSRVRNS